MKKIFLKIHNLVSSIFFDYKNNLPLFWFKGQHNFGDEINVFLVERISNKKVKHIIPKYFLNQHFLCIGSILEKISKDSIVWGSGFIDENSSVKKPKKIYAVRGPKTRDKFLSNNIECPEIYGDPALLLPRYFTPSFQKKYNIGVIPHYKDKSLVRNLEVFNDVKIIDIQQIDYLNFIEELSQCEVIISSSLHGLIVSDAYGIDNVWVKFSENVIGNDFKFYDYFASVNRLNEKPCYIDKNSSMQEILSNKKNYNFTIDLEKLFNSCPFHK